MIELDWDKELNINTIGTDASKEDEHHYPYEPTPYSVLERLVESEYLSRENIVIDYGCGKGRVSFFLHDRLGCKVVGIDFDENMCDASQKNLENYCRGRLENYNRVFQNIESDIQFSCKEAEKYEIELGDVFYFFNPFSVEILQSVIGKILKSYYCVPRLMKLFFYYPSDEYVSYLMTVPELCFIDEIDCSNLFMGFNQREKILIFEIG